MKTVKMIKFTLKLVFHEGKKYFFGISLLTFFSAIIPLASMINTQIIVNSIQMRLDLFERPILYAIFLFPILSVASQLSQSLISYLTARFKDVLDYRISSRILQIVSNLKLSSFEDPELYDLIQRAENSGGNYPFSITISLINIIVQFFSLLSYILILVTWKWWTLLIICVFPLLSSLQLTKISKNEFEVFQKRTNIERKSWYYANLLNKDINIKETKIFGLESYFLKKFRKIREEFLVENKKLSLTREIYTFFISFISICCTTIVLILVFYEASIGAILIGSLMTYINSITNVKNSFNTIVTTIFKLQQDSLYIENLISVFNLDTASFENSSDKKIQVNQIDKIELINVSFKYPRTDVYVLKNVSLKLDRGNSYSLIGRNGSGKTTLVKLIMGLYQNLYEGTIEINGINLNSIDINSYRECVSSVFQDFTNYQFPINEIISISDRDQMDSKRVEISAENAGAISFINLLPDRFLQQIGNWFPNGIQLSGGQWQKLSIAKAFYKDNASLFIFDEPSSALDSESEAIVYDQFNRLTNQKIGIFITHRLNNVTFNGQIIVLNNGEIEESGTEQELEKSDGTFAHLKNMTNIIH